METMSIALSGNDATGDVVTDFLHGNIDMEKLARLFPDDVNSVLKESTRQEK